MNGEPQGGRGGGEAGASGTPTPVPAQPLSSSTRLAVSLEGKLPCACCGYDLRGVSILGVCPECGTAVRATLLAVVDPLAAELRPIDRPRRVALGLLVWVGGLGIAAVAAGAGLIRQVLAAWNYGETVSDPAWLAWLVALLVCVSALGAAALVKPHDAVPRRDTVMAWVAVALHGPLAVSAVMLSGLQPMGWVGASKSGASAIGPLAVIWEPSPDRTTLRLIAGVTGLGIIICLRPVTRVLVARSLAIRTGRVDRQTMLATAAAIVVVVIGDVLGLGARWVGGGGVASEWMSLAAVTLLGLGGLLLCIGLFSSLVDSVRIARAIIRPGPSMQQVLFGTKGAGQ